MGSLSNLELSFYSVPKVVVENLFSKELNRWTW